MLITSVSELLLTEHHCVSEREKQRRDLHSAGGRGGGVTLPSLFLCHAKPAYVLDLWCLSDV